MVAVTKQSKAERGESEKNLEDRGSKAEREVGEGDGKAKAVVARDLESFEEGVVDGMTKEVNMEG